MKEREERLTIKDSLQDIGKGDELAAAIAKAESELNALNNTLEHLKGRN